VTEVRILVINCMSVSTGPKHAADILRSGLDHQPDLVLAVECSDFRASVVDRRGLYDWNQPGAIGDQASGCAIGVRRDAGALKEVDMRIGSNATSEGRHVTGHGIGTRLILRGWVELGDIPPFRAAVGHAPPNRAPKARAEFMRRFARVRAKFKGGDLNLPRRLAARALGRRVVGDGVLWLAMPRRGWRLEVARAINVGGDHKAVLATVHKRDRARRP
jgi:hypothetical protein